MRSPNGQRITKACEYCGKIVELHPYRAQEFHYCSRSCRAKAKPNHPRSRVQKTCGYCANTFEVVKSREGGAKFCSGSCRSKHAMGKGETARFWNGGDITFDCVVCGKTVTRRRGNTGGTYKFCSNSCHDRHRQRRETGTCYRCGKSFERKKSHAKRYDKEFCSVACHALYAVRENSHLWKGGERGRKFYPKEWSSKFKKMIRERDNYTCAICKQHGTDVHHINYVKADTNPGNCVTLCKSCHARTNSNREYWTEYFSKHR